MAESHVGVAPDGTGKAIDATTETTADGTVYRQRVSVGSVGSDNALAIDAAGKIGVNNFPATQPVSLAAASEADGHSATIGTTTDLSSASTLVGLLKAIKAFFGGGLPAALAGSGGLKVDLGGTGANATAVKVDGSAVTQPVSGTFWQATQPVSAPSLPLPTGAATAAKQPALGTAGAASADVISVQGVASMTAFKVDGSAVTQPVSGTVTTTPPANASANVAQIAGSAAVNPSAQAGAWFVQSRQLATYTAVYRLAARPYAISKVFTAGSRFQFATIHHPVTATKTVKLKRVEVAIESASVAGILMADLVRITAAPATGNPAITPSPTNPGDAAAEATCLTLPTTAGTEAALHATLEWNLGITGAASVISPPPAINWYTLWPQTQGASEAGEDKFPAIRAGVLEGFAVTLDESAAATVKGYVVIEFTEE